MQSALDDWGRHERLYDGRWAQWAIDYTESVGDADLPADMLRVNLPNCILDLVVSQAVLGTELTEKSILAAIKTLIGTYHEEPARFFTSRLRVSFCRENRYSPDRSGAIEGWKRAAKKQR